MQLMNMIQIYTGDGKGKTTAALGLAVRAAGAGLRVAWVAFDKGGENYSERKVLAERFPEIEFCATGIDRIDPETRRFRFGVSQEDRREGERGLKIVEELFARAEHDLIVLDEINSSVALGIVEETRVLEILNKKPENAELILTGRNAPESFIQTADLVTDMKPVKHYFSKGVKTRKGIDY